MNFISTFVEAEHALLDKLLEEFFVGRNNLGNALVAFLEFKRQLLLHMKLEDDYLFPRLIEYFEMDKDSGLAMKARQDHLIIQKLVLFVEKACLVNDEKKVMLAAKNLQRSLNQHHLRERELQYPVSDRFIPREEWNLILIKVYGERETSV